MKIQVQVSWAINQISLLCSFSFVMENPSTGKLSNQLDEPTTFQNAQQGKWFVKCQANTSHVKSKVHESFHEKRKLHMLCIGSSENEAHLNSVSYVLIWGSREVLVLVTASTADILTWGTTFSNPLGGHNCLHICTPLTILILIPQH